MTLVGVDSNVLLRLIVNDDPMQRKLAARFVEGLSHNRRGYVGLVVLAELFWTLTSRYRYPRLGALEALSIVIESGNLEFEELEMVVGALRIARLRNADFADLLIVGKNASAGCSRTVTFDRQAAKSVPSMELLA